MSLDPDAQRYLKRLAELAAPPIEEAGVEEARRRMEAEAAELFGPTESVSSVQDLSAAGVPVRVYGEADGHLPTLVYFHGGGWVLGSVDTHDGVCRALAARAGCRVISVGYRLAPEHPFPAAVEDCWEVTRWALGRSPAVAVGGDSAGGNLAAVVALRARDAGLRLALQLLIYPVTDHRFDTASYHARGSGFGLTLDAMRFYWSRYLGKAAGSEPEASPLRAPTLAGTAPARVVVCEYDPLRDEGMAYARRLQEAGVATVLSEYHGMIHGFLRMPAVIGRAQAALDECAAAVRDALAPRGWTSGPPDD